MGSTASAPALMKLTADNLSAGTYYITTNANNVTIYLYAIVVSYEVAAEPGKPEKVVLSADDLEVQGVEAGGTLAWGEIAELIGHKDTANKIKVEASGKQLVGDASDIKTTNRINIGGSAQTNGCQTIKLTLNAPCTVKVYVTAGTANRKVNLYNASKAVIDAEQAFTITDTAGVYEAVFEVTQNMLTEQNNTVYLGADGSFHVYYITVEYTA